MGPRQLYIFYKRRDQSLHTSESILTSEVDPLAERVNYQIDFLMNLAESRQAVFHPQQSCKDQ